jgi:hypothetical protein
MAAITTNQEKTWKQEAIDRASVVSDRWDVLMAWLGHFAVPVLTISMFVSIAGMFPGVHYWEWASSAILLLQVIFLDVGGLSLKTLASQAQDKGQARAAGNGRKMSMFLIGLLITTLALVTVNQLAPVAGKVYGPEIKTVAGYIDIGLILVRVISIVLYLNVVHDLKEHPALSIQPTQSPTQPTQPSIQIEIEEKIEQRFKQLLEELQTVQKSQPIQEPTQPTQPSIQVVEEPTHEFGALMAGLSIIGDVARFAMGEPIVNEDVPLIEAAHKPVETIIYPPVPGVSAEKVKQLITLFEAGTQWRDMPGNYSQTIKPVRALYESLHASTHDV